MKEIVEDAMLETAHKNGIVLIQEQKDEFQVSLDQYGPILGPIAKALKVSQAAVSAARKAIRNEAGEVIDHNYDGVIRFIVRRLSDALPSITAVFVMADAIKSESKTKGSTAGAKPKKLTVGTKVYYNTFRSTAETNWEKEEYTVNAEIVAVDEEEVTFKTETGREGKLPLKQAQSKLKLRKETAA